MKVNWLTHRRAQRELLANILSPLLSISLYIFIYVYLGVSDELAPFVIVGTTFIIFWFNILFFMSIEFYREKERGFLAKYLLSPTRLEVLLLGVALGNASITSSRVIFVFGLCVLIFGLKITLDSIILTIIIGLLTISSLYCFGLILTSVFIVYGRAGNHFAFLLAEPLNFLSGVNYPVKFLPIPLQLVASFLPITIGLDAIRQVIITDQHGLFSLEVEVIILLLIALFSFIISVKVIRKLEEKGRNDGSLISQWT